MLTSVDLHNESFGVAGKVRDVTADPDLAAEVRAGCRLEASQLPPQLVPLLLPEALHVRFVVGRERDPRARDELLTPHGVGTRISRAGA